MGLKCAKPLIPLQNMSWFFCWDRTSRKQSTGMFMTISSKITVLPTPTVTHWVTSHLSGNRVLFDQRILRVVNHQRVVGAPTRRIEYTILRWSECRDRFHKSVHVSYAHHARQGSKYAHRKVPNVSRLMFCHERVPSLCGPSLRVRRNCLTRFHCRK